MKIIYEKNPSKPLPVRYISYAIAALLLSVVHLVLIRFIEIDGISPDLLLILCVWIAIYEGQFKGIFAGFAIGLLFDVISTDIIGINALSKATVGLIAGAFYRENEQFSIMGSLRFLLVVLLSSVAHNVIYYFFYIKLSQLSDFGFILKFGLASSLYTAVIAIFPMLARFPRKGV